MTCPSDDDGDQDLNSKATVSLVSPTRRFTSNPARHRDRDRIPWLEAHLAVQRQQARLGMNPLWSQREFDHGIPKYARTIHWHPELRSTCPQWVHLAIHQDLHEIHGAIRRLQGWKALLDDWDQMQRLMREDAAFRDSLSPAHKRSFGLLASWWSAAYCDREVLDATVRYLEKCRTLRTDTDPTIGSLSSIHATGAQTDTCAYHSHMFRLFLHEFHPRCWDPHNSEDHLTTLQTSRYKASQYAAVQKMSYAALHPIIGATTTTPEPYPTVLLHDHYFQALTPALVTRRPFYLWDTETRRTVVVGDLPTCTEYVCISHTWGRWRTRKDAGIEGVPWPVPENNRHDVRELPEHLARLGARLGIRYVWMDLLCIPQDKSELANDEIANQASVFKRSTRCIAWLHDVDHWGGVLCALDWISLKSLFLMSTRHRDPAMQDRLKDASRAAAKSVELFKNKQPSSWFTSLWTLQESVLCPDMDLYTRTWERLEDRRGSPISLRDLMVFLRHTGIDCWLKRPHETAFGNATKFDGDRGLPILQLTSAQRANYKAIYPRAVRRMYEFADLLNLNDVLTSGSPTDVLIKADWKQCTSPRAPAIMSAVGVTDWYKQGRGGHDEPLVWGRYPLAFLREAATKFGSPFYNARNLRVFRKLGTPEQLRTFYLADEERRGSMLPVSPQGSEVFSSPVDYVDQREHSSVSRWVINQDGSVTMPSIGIVMSSKDVAEPWRVKASASFTYESVQGGHQQEPRATVMTMDFLEALQKLSSEASRPIYAVALHQVLGNLYGVLVEKLPLSPDQDYLIKIGTFYVMSDRAGFFPEETRVDWIVL